MRHRRVQEAPRLGQRIAAGEDSGTEPSSQLRSLLEIHYHRRPAMQLPDVYKLLYQAHMGIGHLVSSVERAFAGIEREMTGVFPGILPGFLPEIPSTASGEPLWEDISPGGAVGRVNLRPFREQGLDTHALAQALFGFAANPPGDVHKLAQSWAAVGGLIEEGQLAFRLDEYRAFTMRILRDNYPLVHHSQVYREAYKPAYRILSKELFGSVSTGAPI